MHCNTRKEWSVKMSAGSNLLLLPEIMFVIGVITWSLGGYLTGCLMFFTICLYIKNLLLFFYRWNHVFAKIVIYRTFSSYIICSYYCVSIQISWYYWDCICMNLMRCNNDHNRKTQKRFYYFWCYMWLHLE